MSNTLLTISMITNESLMVLKNETTFTSKVYREYDDRFAIEGAKIGDTVNVRRPARYIGTTGPNLNVEDTNQTSTPVVLTTQFHVDSQFNTKDLTLSLGSFSENIIQPAMAAIANKVDADGLLMAKNATANIVGVAGTAPTDFGTYLLANAYLDAEATPKNGKRSATIEPFSQAAIVNSLKGLLTPTEKIGEQFMRGRMGRDTAGMDWMMDQNVMSQTFGSWASTIGALTVNTTGAFPGSLTTGWATSSTISIATTQGVTLNQGDVIQIAGVYAVNPQTRQIYGGNKLRNFVITQTVSSSGSATLTVTVSPAIITAGQFQNVSIPTGAASSTAAVTPFNITGQVSPQNIVMHRNAFTMVNADLELPGGLAFGGRASDKETGLSVRIIRQYTINNDALPARFDVLYGWAPLYPELACRVAA